MRGFIKPPRPRPQRPPYCKTCAKIYLRFPALPVVCIAETYRTRLRHMCLQSDDYKALCGIDTSSHKWLAVGTRVVLRNELIA